ncbi:MAG: hypothetical protein WCA20_11725 [Candidatus Sulfotelmatobacter sp.]
MSAWFPLGQIVATPGALAALERAKIERARVKMEQIKPGSTLPRAEKRKNKL